MRLYGLKRIYKRITGYFLLIIFCGYFASVTFFSHTHIVDGVTIVHSHPYKSHSGNIPFNHNHSKEGFILIHLMSNFITTTTVIFIGVVIFRNILNIRIIVPETNPYFSLYLRSPFLPRAPTY